MPGTPPTSPNLGLPRFSDNDVAAFSNQVNSLVDALDASGNVHHPGDLIPSAASTRAGCLLCDGSAVSRTTYARLYAAIGTAYGAGDGSATFNLPDLRGRVPVGAGSGPGLTSRTLGQMLGEELHALSVGELAVHSHGVVDTGHGHGVNDPGHAHASGAGGYGYLMSVDQSRLYGSLGGSGGYSFLLSDNATIANFTATDPTGIQVGTGVTGISLQNAGSGSGHNTMQPSTVISWFIVY